MDKSADFVEGGFPNQSQPGQLNGKEMGSYQILLKDSPPGSDRQKWLSFSRPVEILQTDYMDDVIHVMEQVEEKVNHLGLYAAGFISYEAGPAFNPSLHVRQLDHFPLVWFGLYPSVQVADLPPAITHQHLDWQPSVTLDEYYDAIELIKDNIARGYTYQVNYTIRLQTEFRGDPWELFLQLANAQRGDYAAYVDTGHKVLVSASPELFFSLEGMDLISQPMKGTAPRGRTLEEDKVNQVWLHGSEKNRAENVMIVDMIRNDMGKVADIGSVHVPELFKVVRFPTVWQMISTVRSRTQASCVDILKAMFPCASITGAPKPSTMKIIAGLETEPRKTYTGAIGYIAPQRKAQFNVAIRTVLVDVPLSQAEYGVGGGIVWDSDNKEEYQECLVKALVLSAPAKEFSLLETILWKPEEGFVLLEKHLQRLEQSAEYFIFPVNLGQIREELNSFGRRLSHQDHKVRLLVHRSGQSKIESAILEIPEQIQPVRLSLAVSHVDSSNPFLYHKTTYRQMYEDAVPELPDVDDVILWNEHGEVTETRIANLVYQQMGEMFTPPVSSGLLPGTFRSILLDEGRIREKTLSVLDLASCERLFVINSVRRWQDAVLLKT